jgi:hypothetical protein
VSEGGRRDKKGHLLSCPVFPGRFHGNPLGKGPDHQQRLSQSVEIRQKSGSQSKGIHALPLLTPDKPHPPGRPLQQNTPLIPPCPSKTIRTKLLPSPAHRVSPASACTFTFFLSSHASSYFVLSRQSSTYPVSTSPVPTHPGLLSAIHYVHYSLNVPPY